MPTTFRLARPWTQRAAGGVRVDELDEAAGGVGEAGFADGDDDLALRKNGLDLGGGVEDEVAVGAGSDHGAVQDLRLGSLLEARPARARTAASRGPV